MRPALLNPLFASITNLKGVGAKLDKLLSGFLPCAPSSGARLVDVIFHLPWEVVDRRLRPLIADLPLSGTVTVEAVVGQHRPPPPYNKRLPYRVVVSDKTGTLTLVFFKAYSDHLKRLLPEGEIRFISGEISWYGDEPQMAHPDYVVSSETFAEMPLIEPVYPLTAGLSGKILNRMVKLALNQLPQLPEWQDQAFLAARQFPDFGTALHLVHQPQDAAIEDAMSPARQRLAYDELLANQLALGLVRLRMRKVGGRVLRGNGDKRQAVLMQLPYQLTGAQDRAIATIIQDMAHPYRMIRLLQGDVGSGKTIVAFLALVTAVEAGAQGAFMVPTEILARQHLASLSAYANAAGVRLGLLTGREKGKARQEILKQLQSGEIDIVIGTHALFQDGVVFRDIGLVVIDEQHRFGVHQRLALQAKAGDYLVDLLVMTATPIPRTLALTLYGDMEVTKLDEKPAGRLAIDTRVMPLTRLDEVVAGLSRSLAQGQRVYWVCPLVSESELIDLAAAEARFTALASLFPGRVGLVHGKLKGLEKDALMLAFKTGEIDILVSTTVIEVGVDVPEASIMIIENAERFGLAQLHQLRGRVGRGSAKSSCLLLYQEPLGEMAKARLKIMRETEDGFRIAEEDLKLRGAGEMLGTQQAGVAMFRLADLSVHGELLATARDDVALILNRDPELASSRGQALRILLYLFEREEAIRLLGAG